ncbi:MAG: hypothetical protein ABJE95_14050 [Byssovorax sp.]
MRARLLALFASISLLGACGAADPAEDPAVADEADLTATLGGFSLGLNALGSTGGQARIHGVVNQPIESARAFIPDDEVGSTKSAPKSFTSSFHPGELQIFLNGRPAFFSVATPTATFVGRGDLGVKMHLASPLGAKVTSAATSVLVNGVALVRVKGTFVDPLVSATTTVNGVAVSGIVSGTTWRFDYPIGFMASAIASLTPIAFTLTTAQGAQAGQLGAAIIVKKNALTQGDPYEVWAAPACVPSVLSCVQQPANAVDTAACGDAFHVAPCWKQLHP